MKITFISWSDHSGESINNNKPVSLGLISTNKPQSLFLLRGRGMYVTWGQKSLTLGKGDRRWTFPRFGSAPRRQLFLLPIFSFPASLFINPRLACGSDYAVVLDTTARTAFPATRPSNGAPQSNAVVDSGAKENERKRERGGEMWKLSHFFFIRLEFAVRMSEADDDVARLRPFVQSGALMMHSTSEIFP